MDRQDESRFFLRDVCEVGEFTDRLSQMARDPYSTDACFNFNMLLNWLVSIGVPIYEAVGTIYDCSGFNSLHAAAFPLSPDLARRRIQEIEGIGYRFALKKGDLTFSWSILGMGRDLSRKDLASIDPEDFTLEFPFAQFSLEFSRMDLSQGEIEDVSVDVESRDLERWTCVHMDYPEVTLPFEIRERFPEGSSLNGERAFLWLTMMWQFFQGYSAGD